MIEKTDIKVDIEALRYDFQKNISKWPVVQNRICLNNYKDEDDYEKNASIRLIYTEHPYMNSIFKNTIWEKTLNLIPGKIGRARLMIMEPGKSLRDHRDLEIRWHLALFTDKTCVMYDVEESLIHHVPSDGYFYKLDARKMHSVQNFSHDLTRVHLVVAEYV
jgi:hypothetical protein